MSICLVRLGNDADAAHSHTRTDRALVPARFCRNSPVFFPTLRQLQITGTVVAARLLISVVRWATKAQVATYRGCSRLSSIIPMSRHAWPFVYCTDSVPLETDSGQGFQSCRVQRIVELPPQMSTSSSRNTSRGDSWGIPGARNFLSKFGAEEYAALNIRK